jgi:hypothetical protein
MIIDYLECLLDIEKVCLRFKDCGLEQFFTDDKGKRKDEVDTTDLYFCYTPAYRTDFDIIKQVVEICDLFGIKYLERSQQDLRAVVHTERGSARCQNWKEFRFNIKNTLRYTQLLPENEDDYTCKVAHSIKEASELFEKGFEYVTEIEGAKLFRKLK